jgi:hypothetical protein
MTAIGATTPLARRGLRPASVLAAARPHGDRLRYVGGCRCAECRMANNAYEKVRAAARKAGDWNGIVDAAPARAHLAELSKRGVGRRVVADVAAVASTVLQEIVAGRKTRIRARTARSILAVTERAAADRAYIDAGPTWELLDELIDDGYTKTELAIALGRQTRALQLSRRGVTVRNAYDVAKLHERLRFCAAGETRRLLQDLADEGFRRDPIEVQLADLARERGVDAPDLTIRRDRVLQSTAMLLAALHARLTE